jgi:hypothetical protein
MILVMDLRALKKEIHELSDMKKGVAGFKESWIKPLRSNTNSHLPFLQNLDGNTRKLLNKKVALLQDKINAVASGQNINEKLKHYSRYLIDMKLNMIQGNEQKSLIITNRLLNDEVLNIKKTIAEVNQLESEITDLLKQYEEVNTLLQQSISLDETIFFMDMPHKMFLYNLKKTAQKQRRIVRQIGENFVMLAKQARERGISK